MHDTAPNFVQTLNSDKAHFLNKGGFNSYKSLFKIVFLSYRDIAKKRQKSISNRAEIISQLSIVFGDRITGHLR